MKDQQQLKKPFLVEQELRKLAPNLDGELAQEMHGKPTVEE